MSSRHRRCDKRCHAAKRRRCGCWCGGLFHGAAGESARVAFVNAYGAPIPAESPELGEPLLHWPGARSSFTVAMEVARVARKAADMMDAMHAPPVELHQAHVWIAEVREGAL